MKVNTMLDSETGSREYEFLRTTTYKIGVLVIVLIIINLILNQMIPLEEYSLIKSDGSTTTIDEMRKTNIINTVLIVPLSGFVLGSILSFIPFNKLQYTRKYLRFSLLIIVVLYVFQSVSYLNLLLI